MNESNKTRIAHLAGPTATIQNTPPLVTSQSTDWRDRPVIHAYRLGHPPRPPPPSIK